MQKSISCQIGNEEKNIFVFLCYEKNMVRSVWFGWVCYVIVYIFNKHHLHAINLKLITKFINVVWCRTPRTKFSVWKLWTTSSLWWLGEKILIYFFLPLLNLLLHWNQMCVKKQKQIIQTEKTRYIDWLN